MRGKMRANFNRSSTGYRSCNNYLVGLCRCVAYLDCKFGGLTLSRASVHSLAVQCMAGIT